MPKTLHIFDRAAWERQQVSADVNGDNVAWSIVRNGAREYFESWGEHGPHDFDTYGFRVQWTHADDLTPEHQVCK